MNKKLRRTLKIKMIMKKKQNKSKSDPKKELAKLPKKILNQIKKKQKIESSQRTCAAQFKS